MATVKDTAHLLALKKRIEAMKPSDRVRLCAELLDAGSYEIVETLLGNVVDELRLVRMLGRPK